MTIMKLHGTSGSGKTTAIRSLLEKSIHKPIEWEWDYKAKGRNLKTVINEITLPEVPSRIFILGSYANTCGGVDTIADVNAVAGMIDHLHPPGGAHVIYEGLLTSTYYGTLGEHSKKYGHKYVYAFLNTPVDLCIERVKKRRIEAGNLKTFNTEPTREKHRVINRLKEKVIAMEHTVLVLDHEKPMYDQIIHNL